MAKVEGEAEKKARIDRRQVGKSPDEMIERSKRKTNEMFLKEIEKEKQETERKGKGKSHIRAL